MSAVEDSQASAPTRPAMAVNAIAVAAELFSEKGFHATTTRDVSRTLGVTNGTFYHYFPSKELLLLEICREAILRQIEALDATIGDAAPSRQLISRVIETHLSTRVKYRSMFATMLTESRALGDQSRAAVLALGEAYRARLSELIARSQTAGIIRTDLSPEALTLALLNLLNYATLRAAASSVDLLPSDQEAAATLETIFMDGASPR